MSKRIKTNFYILILCAIFVISAAGCDKITSFLSEYFPSMKKKETTQATRTSVQPKKKQMSGDVLAKVGSWTITKDEFNEKLEALKELAPEYDTNTLESKQLVLEELIRQQLLVQDAERTGIANKKEIVDAVEEFRRTLLVREIATNITENVTVTADEAREYYEQNPDVFTEPLTFKLREIVVPTQTEANQILIELLQGADFGEMAKMRSQSASASEGGDLGYVSEFGFAEMESAVSPLDAGGISSIFKGPDGYYIVKLEDKKGGTPQSFEEISEDIQAGLTLMKQQEAILDYIEKLKEKTDIEINEDLLAQ